MQPDPLSLTAVLDPEYPSLDAWAADSDYTKCRFCPEWVDSDGNVVSVGDAYITAKTAELEALRAEFDAHGGRGVDLAERIDLLAATIEGDAS